MSPGESAPGESPLVFPTDYPIKVVIRVDLTTRAAIDAVVRRSVPDLAPEQVSERPSANGRFVSITYAIVATSREQVVALVGDLSRSAGVMMVI